MGGKKSRRKGASFELEVAGHLTKWVGTKFTRTPSSGGWNKTGDLTPKDPKEMIRFPFNIECKNNEQWNMPMLFKFGFARSSCFGKWWRQCSGDASKSSRIPLVIFTRNFDEIYGIVRADIFRKLELDKTASIYIRCGKYRVFLWKELLKVPYAEVIRSIGVSRK